MCCVKICIKLDKKDTIGKEIEKRNKQTLFISQDILLPEKMIIIVKLQNTEKLIFRWRQRERRRAMT